MNISRFVGFDKLCLGRIGEKLLMEVPSGGVFKYIGAKKMLTVFPRQKGGDARR
jgi:hypothetical protein